MVTRVKFHGGKDLERMLLQTLPREAKKIGRAAVRKAATQIRSAARDNVPVDQGRLKRAISVRVDREFSNGVRGTGFEASVFIKFSGDYRPRKTARRSRRRGGELAPARYSYQIGSAPKVYGAFVEYGTVDTPAQPFFRPAWDSQGGTVALKRIGDELGLGLEKLGKRG